MLPKSPQPLAVAQIDDAHLTMATVVALTGLSEMSVRRLVNSGKFPAAITTSPGCRRWRAAAVTAWLRATGA